MKYIYGLICPVSKAISYVGISNNPEKRFEQHMGDTADTNKTRWIRSLRELGLMPTMTILATVADDNGFDEEERWITFGLSVGWPLKNETFPQKQRFRFPFELPERKTDPAMEIYSRYAIPAHMATEINKWIPKRWRIPPADILCVWYTFQDARLCVFYPYLETTKLNHMYGPVQPNWIGGKDEKVHTFDWPDPLPLSKEVNRESIYSSGQPVFGFNDPPQWDDD